MDKKERERWYLDRFLALLPAASTIEITAGESPDFIVATAHGTVGVELTELHRSVPEGVMPGQVQEALRARVVARVKELFDASCGEPLYGSILFNEAKPLTKKGVETLAVQITEVIRSNCPPVGERYEARYDWQEPDRMPGEVYRIATYNVPGSTRSFFYAPGATWIGKLQVADLQRVLDTKEPKVATYGASGRDTWLVVLRDINRMSTWFDGDSPLPAGPFVSSFARVFVLDVFSNKLEEIGVSRPPPKA